MRPSLPSWGFATAGRLLFGAGVVQHVGEVAASLGVRVLVCSDAPLLAAGIVTRVEASLRAAGLEVARFDGGRPEIGLDVLEQCLAVAKTANPDVVVGVGGGSNMDLAKLTALLLAYPGPIERFYGESLVPGSVVPVIAVPTTAGTGSEVSPVAVLSDERTALKMGVSSHHLLPRWALADPELTWSCPPHVTAHSGMDALSHALEAFTAAGYASRDRGPALQRVFVGKNPVSDPLALRAIELIGGHLRRAVADGADREAREQMLLGSVLAGMAFANAGTAAVHALQYPVGARTKSPHGLGNALLMPAVMRYTLRARVQEYALVAAELGVAQAGASPAENAEAAICEVRRLATDVGVPVGLRVLGVGESDLAEMARAAAGITRLIRNNAVVPDEADLEAILRDAL